MKFKEYIKVIGSVLGVRFRYHVQGARFRYQVYVVRLGYQV